MSLSYIYLFPEIDIRSSQMFRKPKQRNLRGRTETDNNEDDQSNVPVTQSVVVQQQTVTTKTVTQKVDAPKALLSFGDDEGLFF